MRRSPNMSNHALQPAEFMEEYRKLTKRICNKLNLSVKKPNNRYSEPELELILRRLVAITQYANASVADVPVDVKDADEPAEDNE